MANMIATSRTLAQAERQRDAAVPASMATGIDRELLESDPMTPEMETARQRWLDRRVPASKAPEYKWHSADIPVEDQHMPIP